MSILSMMRVGGSLPVLCLLGSLLGGCSSFYEKYPTPAAAARASKEQQLARTSYRVQSLSRLEEVQLSDSLSRTLARFEDEGKVDAAAVQDSPVARGAMQAAREAVGAMTGGHAADKAAPAGGRATTDASDAGWLAEIAADNRQFKLGQALANLGRGYLQLLRNMQFQGDTVVDRPAGRVEYVAGVHAESRTTSYAYRMPFVLDLKARQLYWDADQLSFIMNPVTRDKPVRIDLQPLFKAADVMRLHALLRGQELYAMQHVDDAQFTYVPLEGGSDTVPDAYRKIRYQLSLRTALVQYRNYMGERQTDIADAFRDEKTRTEVRSMLTGFMALTDGLDKPGRGRGASLPADAGQGSASVVAGEQAGAGTSPATGPSSFEKWVDNTLDKSTITDWIWLDRQGRLLRADTRHDLHLGNDTDWVRLRLYTRNTYGNPPAGPLTDIRPQQAVSLREAVKGSLAGYLLASLHELGRHRQAAGTAAEVPAATPAGSSNARHRARPVRPHGPPASR